MATIVQFQPKPAIVSIIVGKPLFLDHENMGIVISVNGPYIECVNGSEVEVFKVIAADNWCYVGTLCDHQ